MAEFYVSQVKFCSSRVDFTFKSRYFFGGFISTLEGKDTRSVKWVLTMSVSVSQQAAATMDVTLLIEYC